MKGLKTLAAILMGSCAAGERSCLRWPGGRVPPLRRLRPLARTRNRPMSARRAVRRAPSSAAPRTTSSTPSASNSRRKRPLRSGTGSRKGDALRQQDHLEHPRPHKVTWFVEGKTGRDLRLQGEGVAGRAGDRSASTRRPTTPPSPRVARGEVLYESLLGPLREGRPDAHDGAARPRSSARSGAAGGWDGCRDARASASARGPSPACGSGSRPRARWASAAGLAGARRPHPRRARHAASAGGAGRESRSPSSTRAAARSSRRSTTPDGERIWEPLVCPPPRARRSGSPRSASRPLGAGSGAVRFRAGVGGPRRRDSGRRRSRCTGSPRGTSARWRRRGAELTPSPLAPIYLRPPDAERWRERDTIQTAE